MTVSVRRDGRGRITNQSFGFWTPREIAEGPTRVRARQGPIFLELAPGNATGKMKVHRDDLGGLEGPVDDFSREAEFAKDAARHGRIDQANILLKQAFVYYRPHDASPDAAAIDLAFTDAKRIVDSYDPGAKLLQGAQASAEGAVVAENVRYEESGEAQAERDADAAEINYGALGVLGRQVGGSIGTAGGFYGRTARDIGDKLPPLPKGGDIAAGLADRLLKPLGWALAGYVGLKLLRII